MRICRLTAFRGTFIFPKNLRIRWEYMHCGDKKTYWYWRNTSYDSMQSFLNIQAQFRIRHIHKYAAISSINMKPSSRCWCGCEAPSDIKTASHMWNNVACSSQAHLKSLMVQATLQILSIFCHCHWRWHSTAVTAPAGIVLTSSGQRDDLQNS